MDWFNCCTVAPPGNKRNKQDEELAALGLYDLKTNYYEKLGTAGIEGSLFQIHLLTLFLLNGLKKVDAWRLSTENKDAGKFDDVVFEHMPSKTAILLQAKHRKNEKKNICYKDLFSVSSRNDDFSLPKYFLSYQKVKRNFNIQNVVICTNAGIKLNEEMRMMVNEGVLRKDSLLYLEGVNNIYYTCKNYITDTLKESIDTYISENDKNVNKDIISEENISDFLEHLQLVFNFPNRNMDYIIEEIISHLKFSENLDTKTCSKYIHNKMVAWFKQYRGRYLNQDDAKALFCEIATNKYCEMLERYKISFKNNEINLDNNIMHIIPEREYILNVIKVYKVLQQDSKLIINPDNDRDMQNQIVEAFAIPRYVFLVIVCVTTTTQTVVHQLWDTIKHTLKKYSFKRLIIIGKENIQLDRKIKESFSDSCVYEQKISFCDLTADAQTTFLEKRVIFQGNEIMLKELHTPLPLANINQIINAEVLMKLVNDEKIEVGTKVKYSNEKIENLYIPRTFLRNDQHFSEEEMTELVNAGEKIILLSDCSGMGKTTVLENLAILIKKRYCNLWVIQIDLNSFTEVFSSFLYKMSAINIEELLNSLETTKLRSYFERELFLIPRKVVLMFDGADEISPDYTDVFLNLLVKCSEMSNILKIVVTMRPNIQSYLEEKFSVDSFTLVPFSEENQREFLTNYWTKSLNLQEQEKKEKGNKYAALLIKKLTIHFDKEKGRGINQDLAGIPLLARMIAEIFESRTNEKWEGCKEYIHSDREEPILPIKFDLTNLYQQFIDKKRDIFINVKGGAHGNIVVKDALEDLFKTCHNYHCKLAIDVVFDKRCRLFENHLQSFSENIEKSLLKIGIVQKLNGKLQFIHRTFAEYYTAEYLINQLQRNSENGKLLKFLVNEIIRNDEIAFVAAFLDSFLEKQALSENVFETQNCRFVTFKCLNCYFPLDLRNEGGQTSLHHAVKGDYLNLAEFLLQQGADVNITDRNGQTPLHLAAKRGHVDMVELLLQNGANPNIRDKNGKTVVDIGNTLFKIEERINGKLVLYKLIRIHQ